MAHTAPGAPSMNGPSHLAALSQLGLFGHSGCKTSAGDLLRGISGVKAANCKLRGVIAPADEPPTPVLAHVGV
jgi:hypothetical protein